MSEQSKPGRKPRVTDGEVLDVLRHADAPVLSTAEVADDLPIKRRATLTRLQRLAESGDVSRKQTGGRNTVWWLADEQPPPMPDAETAADRLDGFGLFSGEEGEAFAEAVEASREQFDEDYKERQRDLFGQ